jgi:hypothetical protein
MPLLGCGGLCAAEVRQDDGRVYRLGEYLEVVSGARGFFKQKCRALVSRHQQDFAGGTKRTDRKGSIDAVHRLHHYVCEEVVVGFQPRELDCFWSTVGGYRIKTVGIEDHGQGVGHQVVIVNH